MVRAHPRDFIIKNTLKKRRLHEHICAKVQASLENISRHANAYYTEVVVTNKLVALRTKHTNILLL